MALSVPGPTCGFVSIDIDRLVKPGLDACERALDRRNADSAEYWLNDVAGTFRELQVPNTSPRYRRLSSRAAYLRLGEEWSPED